jgi:hypothetical protein
MTFYRLNLLCETCCSEINATRKPKSKPPWISIIDAIRIIAMMVATRRMKDTSGFLLIVLDIDIEQAK